MHSVANQWTVAQLLDHCSKRPVDDVAWQEFVRRYHSTIRGNVIKTFHQKARQESDRKPQFPEDLIEDLVQAVYLRLIEDRTRALKRFQGEYANSIYQYLAMISINVVRDYFREMRAQKRPKISCSLDELLNSGGDSAILEEAISRREGAQLSSAHSLLTQDELDQALRKVVAGKNKERDMLIFQLRFYEGLTLEEITRAMGLDISSISVGSILNRIIKKLRPLLDPAGLKK